VYSKKIPIDVSMKKNDDLQVVNYVMKTHIYTSLNMFLDITYLLSIHFKSSQCSHNALIKNSMQVHPKNSASI